MLKLQKQNNKPSPSICEERVDFRFSNFQALQVPKGWDRLSLSIISAGTGKVIAKLGKAVVRTGSCQWPETLLESVWISQDDSSTGIEEYLYKCVVSMGSARSGILGEATINLASYVSSRAASPVSLPLKKCSYGTILQVKIHCLTPRTKLRDEESNGSNSFVKEQNVNYNDSGSKTDGSDNFFVGSVGISSIRDTDSTYRPGKFGIKERSYSPSGSNERGLSSVEGFMRRDKSFLKNERSNHHTGEISGNDSSRDNFLFDDDHSVPNQLPLNLPGVMSPMQNLQHHGKDSSSLSNSGSSKKLLEAAEDTIKERRIEAKMWERNARKLMLDLDILRNEFSDQSKKQADLVMELSAAYAEHDVLKKEIENLRLTTREKHETPEDRTGLTQIHEELENEIRHQHEMNSSLALQLKRSQESNIELVSVLQELEETVEQQNVEIENLSSMQLRLSEMNTCCKSDEQCIHSSELLKQIEEKNSAVEEALRKLQETESSKEELEVRYNNLIEQVDILQKSNSELRVKNVELQEYYKMVETLEEKLNSLMKDFTLKEENCKAGLDELVQENTILMARLAQQEDLSHTLQEKLAKIESLEKQVRETENELNAVRTTSELNIQGLTNELAGFKQGHEKLKAEHEKALKLLTSYRTTEEKLNTLMNDLELKLTISRCEHQQLLEETVNLKEEFLCSRNQLQECRNEKERLEASMQTILGDSEKTKSELTKIKKEQKSYEQKIDQLEEEKDKFLKRILALEADIKSMEEDRQNCRKIGENVNGFQEGGSNDAQEKIKQLENKLAETLDTNKKYKIQLQRFRSEERKTQGAVSKRAITDNETGERERFEQMKSSLETELKDIRERYFEMSLKYAEVEAQRENLVMKLKAAKAGKKIFSSTQHLSS